MLRFSFLFSILILSTISFSAGAAETDLYTVDDLEFRVSENKETVYDKDGKLFTGAVILTDEAQRQMTYFYKNGQKNGVAVSHYDDRQIELEITYKDGLKNGDEVMFYSNGKPQYKRTYSNNALNGEEILYYENGKPRKQSTYVDNVLSGEVHYFDVDGNHIKTETYKNGVLNGPERIIENNTLVAENNYVNGKLDGVCKKFNTKYLTDEISYKNGKRNGVHKIYADDGSVIEVPYINDKKNGVATAYYPNKKVAQKMIYGNDQKNGVSLKFYKNEALATAENYRADKLDGIGRYFDENGKLTAVKYFSEGEEVYSVNLSSDTIHELYDAYLNGRLTQLSDKRDLWYSLLWLGLSTGSEDMLQTLDNEMKMYALKVNDMSVYKKQSEADYDEKSEKFFFGLTPLSYAVSVAADTDTLQRFLNQIDEQNSDGSTALHCAVKSNNVEIVKYLLAQSADIEIKNKKGNTVLFQAIKDSAQPEIITLLIDNTANVNTTDKQKNSPLPYAFENSATDEVITALIHAGADTGITARNGEDLLLYALKTEQSPEVISALLKAGVVSKQADKNGHDALFYALSNDYDTAIIEQIAKSSPTSFAAAITNMLPKILSKNKAEIAKILENADLNNADGHGHSLLLLLYQNDAPEEILNKYWPQKEENDGVKYLETAAENGDSMLLEALKKDDRAMIQKLLKAGVSVGSNSGQESPLTYVLTNQVDDNLLFAILAASTAEQLKATMPESKQPIWKYVMLNKDVGVIENVFEKLKDLQNLRDEENLSPAEIAVKQTGYTVLLNTVLKYLPQTDANIVWEALKHEDMELFDQVLSKVSSLDNITYGGENLLTYIVSNNLNPEFIDVLQKHEFNFELENQEKMTALDVAIAKKNAFEAEKLIADGANLNRIVNKRSYLMNLTYKDTDLTDIFLENNPDISYVTPEGETVLMAAVKNLNLKLIDYLLQKKVDVNKIDNDGNTALLYLADAIELNRKEPRDFLLSKVKTIAENLLSKGADINQRNGNGETVLIRLAQKCPELYLTMAEAFYDFNADSNLKDQTGKTAKDYVAKK